MVRAEGDELQPIRAGLERSGRRGRHADAVQRAHVEDLVLELYPAASLEDDVDLLGLPVAMGERAALGGVQAEERHAGTLGGQGLAGHPRFPAVVEAVGGSGVVHGAEVDSGEGFGDWRTLCGWLRVI